MVWGASVAPSVDATMTLDISIDCDERCFELPEWRELLSRDPNRQVFAYPEWHRAWWEEFKQGKDLFLMTMKRGSETVALVPLYRKVDQGRKILRFVGGIDLTDYLGPICSLEDRGVVAEALVEWLRSTDVEWDLFDGHNMPVPLGFADFLVERADAMGFSVTLDQEETAAVLPLPSDWEAYLGSLDSKQRHEVRRKRRRLEREHPDASFRTTTEETFESDFKTFVDMHRGTEGHKGHFMRPEIATFFRRLAEAYLPLGWLRLDLLEIGGTAVASTFGFEIERKFYLYNSAYEPDAARLSPGLVLVSELVKDSIENDLELFDFLRGPERYKYQLGAQAVPLNNVQISREQAA
jgi:CelD/BcsL family acetyltransferase involved in cellulose biosynthesis